MVFLMSFLSCSIPLLNLLRLRFLSLKAVFFFFFFFFLKVKD